VSISTIHTTVAAPKELSLAVLASLLVKPIRAVSAVTWLSAPNAMVEEVGAVVLPVVSVEVVLAVLGAHVTPGPLTCVAFCANTGLERASAATATVASSLIIISNP
jgi:hypothetical protein